MSCMSFRTLIFVDAGPLIRKQNELLNAGYTEHHLNDGMTETE